LPRSSPISRRPAEALLGEAGNHLVSALAEILADFAQAGGDFLAHAGAASAELFGNAVTRRFEAFVDLAAARGEALFELARGVLQIAAQLLALIGEGAVDLIPRLGQRARDALGALQDLAGKRAAGFLERGAEFVGAGRDRGGELLAGLRDARAHFVGDAAEALHQFLAPRGHVVDDLFAGAAQSGGDVFATAFDRAADTVAGGGNRLDDALGGLVEILREGLVRAGDRPADALGIGDDRLPLGDQLVDQRTDADFIVGIGALQCRDFAAHQRFELTRTGQRPLDTVTDGGDFAAHGLRNGQNRIGREALGLRQTHGDFAHRPRDQLHFLGADRENGGGEEENRRYQHDGAGNRRLRRTPASDHGTKAAIEAGKADQRADPGERGRSGISIGHAGRAHLQRLHQHADALAVVIGHA